METEEAMKKLKRLAQEAIDKYGNNAKATDHVYGYIRRDKPFGLGVTDVAMRIALGRLVQGKRDQVRVALKNGRMPNQTERGAEAIERGRRSIAITVFDRWIDNTVTDGVPLGDLTGDQVDALVRRTRALRDGHDKDLRFYERLATKCKGRRKVRRCWTAAEVDALCAEIYGKVTGEDAA